MKRACLIAFLIIVATTFAAASDTGTKKFSWGCPRDVAWLDAFYPAPCIFPPIASPCAAPCRAPGIQGQSVPCAFNTACPSSRLPCHGVEYGAYPYPLFR